MSNKNPFCLQVNKLIELMASKMRGETPKSVANLIVTYWEDNNVDLNTVEDYPTVEQLNKFKNKIRGNTEVKKIISGGQSGVVKSGSSEKSTKTPVTKPESKTNQASLKEKKQLVHRDFSQKERTDRVILLSDLFSDSLDQMMEEEADSYDAQIEDAIESGDSQLEQDLLVQKARVDRVSLIEKYTPAHVFERVKEKLEMFLQLSPDGAVQLVMQELENKELDLPQEDLRKVAEIYAANRVFAYQKILNNFETLAFESSRILRVTEDVVMAPNMESSHQVQQISLDVNGVPIFNNTESAYEIEETVKEGWMDDFRTVSSKESLSREVKLYINSIVKYDFDGNPEFDDIGMVRKLDSSFVHAVLLDNLAGMQSYEEMMERLDKLSETRPWVDQLIRDLTQEELATIPEGLSEEEVSELEEYNAQFEDSNRDADRLASKFFKNYAKNLNKYWIQKNVEGKDGSISSRTIPVNKSNGSYFMLSSWRDNIDSGYQLNNNSIYDNQGNLRLDKAVENSRKIQKLQQFLNKSNNQDILEAFEMGNESELFDTLVEVLESAGIAINNVEVLDSLIQFNEPGKIKEFLKGLVDNLGVIYRGVSKGEVQDTTDSEGNIIRGDLINTFDTAYSKLASQLRELNDNAFEATFRENGKSYVSYTTPNLIHKIIDALSNYTGDMATFKLYLEDNYGMYDWFKSRDGKWLNYWLEELANNPEARELLDHKVLLHRDRVEYSDQNASEYFRGILSEYFSDANARKNPNGAYAYYYIPVLADASSSEFIKFKRFTRHGKYKVGDKVVDYKGYILDKMTRIVEQEYGRILEVAEVFVKRLEDDFAGATIKRYDIGLNPNKFTEKEKLEIIKYYRTHNAAQGIKYIQSVIRDKVGTKYSNVVGGLEFKFLPRLNYSVTINEENISILDILERADTGESGASIKESMESLLNEMLNEQFEYELYKYNTLGIFEESSKGINIQFPHLKSNSNVNNKLITALEALKREFNKDDSWNPEYEELLKTLKKGTYLNKGKREDILNKIKRDISKRALEDSKMNDLHSQVIDNLNYESEVEAELEEYFWNSQFATSQIIQLFATDLAYFRNAEEFQKRFKMYYSPAQKLNTNSKYGRPIERNVYLSDLVMSAPTMQQIDLIFKEAVEFGKISERQRVSALNMYSEIEATDGQAFRSPSSMRAVLDMAGEWTDAMERAFQNFKEGTWDGRDFDIIIQPIKQFTATSIPKQVDALGRVRKVPTQHKNSELMLTAAYMMSGVLGKSNQIRAIMDFMEESYVEGDPESGIDVIQFSTAVKVGGQGIINIMDLDSYDDIKQLLKESVKDENGDLNPNTIHEIPYEDYGIQVETPDHHIDSQQLIGTQLRKLIPADMDPNTPIRIPGRKYKDGTSREAVETTFKDWYREYNKAIISNVIDSYNLVEDIFNDPRRVEEVLREEIMANSRYGLDLLEACALQRVKNEDGSVEERFAVPLVDALLVNRTMSLVNSIIKSRITKQKIAGGSLIQATNFGYTEDLSIRYKDSEGNLLLSKQDFGKLNSLVGESLDREYAKYLSENPANSIDHLEAYLPWYSKKYLEHLIKEDGTLDVDKVPEELRRVIGYRVPTEDAYSMFHIKIKGFTPPQMGGIIMLPTEIITMSGADFDIDKLYIFVPEFDVITHDKKAALRDFKKANEGNNELLNSLLGIEETEESDHELFNEFFKANKEKYELAEPKLKKKEYRESEGMNNSRGATNNRLIDLMWAKMSHPDTAHRTLKPGSFENIRHASYILNVLSNLSVEEIKDVFPKVNNAELAVEAVLNATMEQLSLLHSMTISMINPLAPSTQLYFQEQNMVGKKLVAIYAVNNSHHALMQHTNIELKFNKPEDQFILDGKFLTKLNRIKNDEGQYISNNNASYLAAAVDNAKDALLNYMHLNIHTASVGALLSRLGYNADVVGAFLSQPSIKNAHFLSNKNKVSIESAIQSMIKKYENAIVAIEGVEKDAYISNLSNGGFKYNGLLNSIFAGNNIANLSNEEKVNFYMEQINILQNYENMLNPARALSDLTQVHKADTLSGGAGPRITDTMETMLKIEKIYDDAELGQFPISNVEEIINLNIDDNLEGPELMEEFLKAPVPFLQAFYTLGVQRTEKLLKPYYPFYNSNFKTIARSIGMQTKRGVINSDLMMKVFSDMITHRATTMDIFSGNFRRQHYINNFPAYFNRMIKSNSDFAENDFIKRLSFVKGNIQTTIPTIQFKTVGALDLNAKDQLTMAWESMFYSSNPLIRTAAQGLFLYGFYRNGFDFGPTSYMHLASPNMKLIIPGYTDMLRSLSDPRTSFNGFIDQFARNNTNNKTLFPIVELKKGNVEYIDRERSGVNININRGNRHHFNNLLMNGGNFDFQETLLVPRLTIQEGNTEYYYELAYMDVSKNERTIKATYKRLKPLGIPNQFKEYNANEAAPNSVLAKNTVPFNKTLDNKFYFSEENIDSAKETFIDEFELQGTREISLEEYNDALQEAYKEVTKGEITLNQENTSESNQDILEKISTRDPIDDEGNRICIENPKILK